MKKLIKKMMLALVIVLCCSSQLASEAATFTTLTSNKKVTSSIATSGEKDNYWYTTDMDGYFTITFTKVDPTADVTSGYSDQVGWNLYINDEEGNVIKRYNNLKGTFTTCKMNFKKGTKFYIAVQANKLAVDVDYTITVNTVADATWEQEENNTHDTAKQIYSGTTYQGTGYYNQDIDCYKYVVDKQGYFQVTLSKPDVTSDVTNGYSDEKGWDLYIHDADGNKLLSYYNLVTAFTTPKLNFKKGTVLYIKVDTNKAAIDVDYNLLVESVSDSDWETEYNETMATAEIIKNTTLKEGHGWKSRDEDCFKYVADGTGCIKYDFAKVDVLTDVNYGYSDEKGWNIEVKDSAGNVIHKNSNILTTMVSEEIPVVGGKTYYITVTTNKSAVNVDYNFKVLFSGWKKNSAGKYTYYSDGYLTKGWKLIEGKWYYFNANKIMLTGWQQIGGKWYYLGTDGAMKKNWQVVGGKWYYLGTDGIMKTSWQKIGTKWYYLGADGVMKTSWQKIGTKWYYLGTDGVMDTGWQKIGGSWYYFGTDGVMKTGWQQIGGKWYYFYSGGKMAVNTTINGCKINSSGVWVK